MEQQSSNHATFAQATDVGCVRELNEDSIYSQSGLWIVADGMGGHACGEVASAMAVAEITSKVSDNFSLVQAIQSAHLKIVNDGQSDASKEGMGTTVVAVVSDDTAYQISWVGDSRAYLWNAGSKTLTQLSEDHSLMVRLVNAGLISEKEALTHPQKHMITQCLGSVEIENVNVGCIENDWEFGQQILLCSDGLTDEISDLKIREIMSLNLSLNEKVLKLITDAKNAAGRDNISVIIIQSPVKQPLSFLNKIRQFFKV